MRTNLNSTSMRNTCPEFPLFGANYPDATCIDGILYDLDNVGDDGVLIKPLEEIPCPFCRTEEFTSSVRLAVIHELKEKFKNELMREISNPISQKIEDIARESMSDLIENASEKKYRFRLDYMDEELTVDEFIRGRMKKVVDSNIETMVESKAKSFVNELRKRYDMAFAAFVVDNMRKQNMLKEDKIAELLKDNPNEK